MANYAILRVAKLTSFGNIAASGQHNFRERVTENADAERTHLNQLDGAQNTADLTKAISDLLPKKRRKDAVICIEYMISGSPEHFGEDWREAENYGADYFKDAIEWLEMRHGKENVVCKTVHLDESTPHLAAYVVPITADGRLAAKDFTGGRSVLAKMQTSFASEVGIKHGLIRGVERSNAVHQENGKISAMTTERLKLRKRVKDLEEEIDRLVKSAGAGGAILVSTQEALEKNQGALALLNKKFSGLEEKFERQVMTTLDFSAQIGVLQKQVKVDAALQSDLMAVQGELVKAQDDLARVKAALFDSTAKVTKLDEYTKNLQARLATSNEKLAAALEDKAVAQRRLVESEEKSAAILETAAGHEAAAEQLRKLSVMNGPTATTKAAQEAFEEKWVGLREASRSERNLKVVDVCGQRVVYALGRGNFAIHVFEKGEAVPNLPRTEQDKGGIGGR